MNTQKLFVRVALATALVSAVPAYSQILGGGVAGGLGGALTGPLSGSGFGNVGGSFGGDTGELRNTVRHGADVGRRAAGGAEGAASQSASATKPRVIDAATASSQSAAVSKPADSTMPRSSVLDVAGSSEHSSDASVGRMTNLHSATQGETLATAQPRSYASVNPRLTPTHSTPASR